MKRLNLLLTVCMFSFYLAVDGYAQPSGYAFNKQITINAAQVGGSLADFPVLISLTDNDLRSTANGGQVQNANGYDILFTLDDCTTILQHQIEKYNPASGQYIAWVKLPSLDNTANTVIRMVYGNPSVTVNPSSASTWDANYRSIWHLSNNNFQDATANANNGTNNGSTNAGGKIGDCRSFTGSQNIAVPFHSSLNVTNVFTFQAWVNPSQFTGNGNGIFSKNTFLADYIFGLNWPQGPAGALNCWLNNGGGFVLYSAGNIPLNQWTNVAITFDGANVRLYINGQLITTTPRTLPVTPSSFGLVIGQGNTGSSSNFLGLIDEPRISDIARSAAWLLTEYNNQNNPAAFFTISPEIPILTYFADNDGDGFGLATNSVVACSPPMGYVLDNTDCDDLNSATYPGASESCDGEDNDCDGTIPPDELDDDMDGYTECAGDCDDNNNSINPAATEVCNGLDDDCNGSPEATTNTWSGNGDTLNWSDPANWSDGIVPLPCQEVVIPAGSNVSVPAGFTAEGKTLQMDNTAQLSVPATAIMEIKNQ